jgi:hypothetical protein
LFDLCQLWDAYYIIFDFRPLQLAHASLKFAIFHFAYFCTLCIEMRAMSLSPHFKGRSQPNGHFDFFD